MNNWQLWDKLPEYGELLYKRATGKIEEMESSKSLAKEVRKIYLPGMKICDVGCGAGHYLLSLRQRIDKNIDYIGTDSTKYYVKLAQKAFGDKNQFIQGDIFHLPFEKNHFDIVICANVLLHLPPPPKKPMSELIRIAKKFVIIRTLIGESNYIIKRMYEPSETGERVKMANLIDQNGNIKNFGFFNMYTKEYLTATIKSINPKLKVEIVPDHDYKKFDNRKFAGKNYQIGTQVIGKKQISGNLIYDWHYIIITK